MEKEELARLLKERLLIMDGAMGTMIMDMNIPVRCNELLNIEKPEIILDIQRKYYEAGADIILTNTFGANRKKLSHFNLGNKVKEINNSAVKIARKAAPDSLIAGELGPLGVYMEPLGKSTFDEAYEIYAEQVKALKEADMIVISTISDIRILKAAIIAAKDNCTLPIASSMTFQGGRTDTGTDVETYAAIADALGVDAIGANCSEGPKEMINVIKALAKNTSKPIFAKPNNGIPKIIDGKTVYPMSAEQFSSFAEEYHKYGVSMIGGCCGTTPEHIKYLAEKLKGKKPITRKFTAKSTLSSRLKTVVVGEKALVVGERINPTGKKLFQDELREGKTNYIRQAALEQAGDGASLLDINVGVAGLDEKKTLPKAVEIVQSLVDAPIVIDSSNIEAVELALKKSDGKPLINSVNGSDKSIREVLPLAKKYGAAIIALVLDEEGIPKTAEKRVAIAKKIIDAALDMGISKEDIYVDCLVLTIATNPENDKIIIDSVKEIKKMGYKTILGVSNISHGMPNRPEINSKFLTKAIRAGLDLAIINPKDNILQENTDIEVFKRKKISKSSYDNLSIEGKLHDAIIYGDEDNILSLVEEGLGIKRALDINNILVDAMSEVGIKFNKKEYFLPQVLASASTMKKAFSRLKACLQQEGGKEKGKVIFATVENDVHDIGKNIVAALLESHNYTIIDLGVSVPKDKIIEAVKKHKPDLVALSALMTTTVVEMEKVINELRSMGINTPVIVGGAVVTKDYSDKINAEYAKDALAAVKKINELIQNGEKNN